MPTETFEFQVEARQLLQLMIHSVYSNKDVFLRELISNASDALDKLRLAALREDTLDADVSDLHIEIETDDEARTLTVRDNGIGMSYDEVGRLLPLVARGIDESHAGGALAGAIDIDPRHLAVVTCREVGLAHQRRQDRGLR